MSQVKEKVTPPPFTPDLATQNGVDISCAIHTDNRIVSGPNEVICQPNGHPEETHVLTIHTA